MSNKTAWLNADDGSAGLPLIEKNVFELPHYTTTHGATIKNVRIGWESYGALNEAKDNVILVTHFFSGTSHAAGRYKPDDPLPGYWDAIIGPGKAIDTNKYFVISSDTLVNMNVKDPNVVTTGPASIDPDTGKPYGMRFPIVTIRDFVNVQKALLDSLGITTLYAVAGPSMGSLQAFEWGASYPEMMQRLVTVIGGAEENAFLVGWLNLWAAPIRLDPNWNGGDYYGQAEPIQGLTEALKLVTLQALQWEWVDGMFGRRWAKEGQDPAASFDNRFAVEAWLDDTAAARAAVTDANHFLYLAKANQLFVTGHGATVDEGLARLKAPVLLIAAAHDLVFPLPRHMGALKDRLTAQGLRVTYTEAITGGFGHLDGLANIAKAGEHIAAFLAA
jgi:homoserine O-acetyltransferase